MNFFNFREKMRRSFSHQPAQSLVIDVGYPTTEITVNNISKALQNVLTISHTFRGKSRIPVFGLSVINDRFTVLQELNSLKVSHVSVKKILDNPLSMIVTSAKVTIEDYEDLLNFSLSSTIGDFEKKSGSSNWPSLMHFTLVTTKSGMKIQELLIKLFKKSINNKIRKVTVVQVADNVEDTERTNNNMIDILLINNTVTDIQLFFKEWLQEYEAESEHARVILPTVDSLQTTDNLIIKCDIVECLLDPSLVPFGHRFTLNKDDMITVKNSSSTLAESGNDTPVYDLHVTQKIPVSGVCSTNIFGLPLLLKPSTCWKMSWSEIQYNTNMFQSVCVFLQQSGVGLLAKIHSRASNDQMSTNFFLTSDGKELLVQSLTPLELSLTTISSQQHQHTSQINEQVVNVLQHVEYTPQYNPLQHSANICLDKKTNDVISTRGSNQTLKKLFTKQMKIKRMKYEEKNKRVGGEYLVPGLGDDNSQSSPPMELNLQPTHPALLNQKQNKHHFTDDCD